VLSVDKFSYGSFDDAGGLVIIGNDNRLDEPNPVFHDRSWISQTIRHRNNAATHGQHSMRRGVR
jgi:hypothetical protein